MTTLYLTAEERKVFEKLPEALRADVNVQRETITFADSPEKVSIRIRNLVVSDGQLLSLKKKISSAKSTNDFVAAAKSIDFSGIQENDLLELYFAMGPAMTGYLLSDVLKRAKNADDQMQIISLSTIRHGLLLSLSSHS